MRAAVPGANDGIISTASLIVGVAAASAKQGDAGLAVAPSATSLLFLALLGAIGARTGGANILRATVRVTFWGALALGVTAGIGKVFAHHCLTIGTAQETRSQAPQ